MLEASEIITNKLVLDIVKKKDAPSELSTLELIWGTLADRVRKVFSLSTTWEIFTHGGQFTSDESLSKAQTALARLSNDTTLWALRIQCKDASVIRRRWIYQVGIAQHDSSRINVFYAKSYYDHMAGSIMAPKAVSIGVDGFPECLFFDKNLCCMCGNAELPLQPIELRHSSIPEFVSYLQNELRAVPIILITCAWALSPEEVQDVVRGNAIVYWCDDANVILRLNALLPGTLFTPWESVHIFVPMQGERQYHPVYQYDDIRRMEEDYFISGLHQAYCQSFRSEDKRSFPTISDVQKTRDKMLIDKLIAQSETQTRDIRELKKKIGNLEGKIKDLSAENELLLSQKPDKDIIEYESVLNETMEEVEAFKNGVTELSTRLYSTMGVGFQPNESEPIAQIQELQNAIFACLARVGLKK